MADIKPPLVSLSEHPRAAYAIRRWKAIVSLAGFLVAAGGSWWNGVPLPDALFRGLIGGVAGYFVGGFAARHGVAQHAAVRGADRRAARPGAAAARAGTAAER